MLKLDWHFEGDMKDYPASNILSTFLKWVLTGPHPVPDENDHYHKVYILHSKISQLGVQNVKTDKQMRTLKTSENIRGYSTVKTLSSIGIGLYLYQHARSKELINSLTGLNISANYKKVIHLKKEIANSIEMRWQEDDCDWKWDDAHKVYQPILTTNLPAPESSIELSSCKCKTGCNSGRGRCHKNSLVCSEMCLCQNCQNSVEEYKMPHQVEDHEQ